MDNKKSNKKYNLGLVFVVGLVLISVVLWFMAPGTGFDFSSTVGVLMPLGQLLGIVGFMLFAINIILSVRLPFLENMFYGLNKVYEKHAQIGKLAFYLLIFHPLTLFVTYNGFTFNGFLEFFTPSMAKGPVNFGILALLLLIVLISLTIYFKPKYHIWKWTHKFLGVALFFGAVHAFLMPSTVANFLPLKYFVFSIFTLSMIGYIYHTALGHFLIRKYKYIVTSVKVLGGNITEVELASSGRKIAFTAGQFAFISFVDKNVKIESHPFSFSSNATSDTVSFSMKSLGDFTSTLPTLAVGAEALIEGPFGKFSYKEGKNKKQIWIAGGIGVTPFLSMIHSVAKDGEYEVDFYYCLRNEQEAVHLDVLRNFTNEKIKLIVHYSDVDGFINGGVIQKSSNGFTDKDIFLCAPPAMIRVLRKQLIDLGVNKDDLYSEEFNLR